MAFEGYFYSSTGSLIYPSPRQSPGKYRRRPVMNREIKRNISQYDHAELVDLSTKLSCRVPSLRAAIRDKNSWAFSYWQPLYMGEDEAWGEEAENYLNEQVLPFACFRELRPDFSWGMKMSGMGLDMHGDDLCVFTEDEQHNPRVAIIPSPLIGNGESGITFSLSAGRTTRQDGMGTVEDGDFKGAAIYNGLIRQGNRWVGVRVLGFKEDGTPTHIDLPLDASTHLACETEFFGQGRGLPRIAASVLHWMNKEEIDDQFLKGLKNAAQRAVIHKLAPGMDAQMALGNAITPTVQTVPVIDGAGNVSATETEQETVWVEYTQDGNVQYIGADEDLGGIQFENPHPNAEAFAVRVLMECLADLGWSWSLIDTSMVSRAPTRMETSKANNSMTERQSIQEIRSVRFFQYAIAKGMESGKLKKNRNGLDPFKWGIGFPKEMSVDQGNDTKSALDRLRMGLTNERIEAAKEGLISKRILRDREKEVQAKIMAASRARKFAESQGETITFDQAMSYFYQPTANVPQPAQPAAQDNQNNKHQAQ